MCLRGHNGRERELIGRGPKRDLKHVETLDYMPPSAPGPPGYSAHDAQLGLLGVAEQEVASGAGTASDDAIPVSVVQLLGASISQSTWPAELSGTKVTVMVTPTAAPAGQFSVVVYGKVTPGWDAVVPASLMVTSALPVPIALNVIGVAFGSAVVDVETETAIWFREVRGPRSSPWLELPHPAAPRPMASTATRPIRPPRIDGHASVGSAASTIL